jgi:PleD family two-component response regulator
MVVMPGRELSEARLLVDSLRALTPAGQTFSAGVSQWDGSEHAAAALHRADVAMYVAKRSGRDRVVADESDQPLVDAATCPE